MTCDLARFVLMCSFADQWLTDSKQTGQVPFVVYYTKVGLEVGKIVFRGQNMTPP